MHGKFFPRRSNRFSERRSATKNSLFKSPIVPRGFPSEINVGRVFYIRVVKFHVLIRREQGIIKIGEKNSGGKNKRGTIVLQNMEIGQKISLSSYVALELDLYILHCDFETIFIYLLFSMKSLLVTYEKFQPNYDFQVIYLKKISNSIVRDVFHSQVQTP